MAKQLSLIKAPALTFGGSEKSGNPRTTRTLCTKRPIHLVMRSSKATGARSFLKFKKEIEVIVDKHAERFGVRIYDCANAGNHLHFVLKISRPQLFKNFLRVIAGLIARLVLKAEKSSKRLKQNEKFWDARPFTRIAAWGRAYEDLKDYLRLNKLEALGFIKHQARNHKRQKLFRVSIEPITIGIV